MKIGIDRKYRRDILLAVAMLGSLVFAAEPTMARTKSWHDKNGAYVEASSVVRVGRRHCVRAPDVGAFASAPYTKPPCEPAYRY